MLQRPRRMLLLLKFCSSNLSGFLNFYLSAPLLAGWKKLESESEKGREFRKRNCLRCFCFFYDKVSKHRNRTYFWTNPPEVLSAWSYFASLGVPCPLIALIFTFEMVIKKFIIHFQIVYYSALGPTWQPFNNIALVYDIRFPSNNNFSLWWSCACLLQFTSLNL